MKKPITQKVARKLSPQMAQIIRGSFGFRAAIAKAGGFHKSYVTRVLQGVKPPSIGFMSAMAAAFDLQKRRTEAEIVRMEVSRLNPEILKSARLVQGEAE